MALSKAKKAELVAKYGKDANDTGSIAVQIAILTEEINELNQHLSFHIHDFASRRGLLMKVGQRRKLQKYLQKRDPKQYLELIKSLGLRR